MRVLVIGQGGREHAIAWKLSQSQRVSEILVSPGNGGTRSLSKCRNVPAGDIDSWLSLAQQELVDFVFVGPEQPLVNGITERLKKVGIPCFGPSSRAAEMEASKKFSKAFMERHNIPTPKYSLFSNFEEAKNHLETVSYPIVLKASGLASGKGVFLPKTVHEAVGNLKDLMISKVFGSAGEQVVIEERLEGAEVSVMAFTDGHTVEIMPPAQDHKRVGDGDTGPNTGGMGAFAPSEILTESMKREVKDKILQPAIDGMRREGRPYVGVIYAGLILTKHGIQTLEFNCRMGDPETQAILTLLETDLVDIAEACVESRLDSIDIHWKSNVNTVTVVLASEGYPGNYTKGKLISGLEACDDDVEIYVFHAGTEMSPNGIITSGGRVLAVTACTTGNLKQSVTKAYEYVNKVSFEGVHFRKDIALQALQNTSQKSYSYRDSGVDIEGGDSFVSAIKPIVKATARPGATSDLGGFGGLFDLKDCGYEDPILVSGADGVGTKLLLADSLGKHDTIGIDLVAMSVNDILVQGAEPLFFLDYYATGKLNTKTAYEVVKGIAEGCRQSNCALIGGETAEMPGMYSEQKYDLAGFAVGAVERSQILPKEVFPGDVILGLASSGLHSNGYSLVRLILSQRGYLSNDSVAPWNAHKKLYHELLEPTRIYVKSCLKAIHAGYVKALAHITGGGLLLNVPRVIGESVAVEIDLATWNLPPIFQWIQQEGNIAASEMLKTFNCGIGMVLITTKEKVDPLVSLLRENNETVFKMGTLIQRKKEEPSIKFINSWQCLNE